MNEDKGPWIEIWEECELCHGTGRDPQATHPSECE